MSLSREAGRARREDLEWMDETGETLTGACRRLGLGRSGLEKWMDANGLNDMKNRMSARDHHPETSHEGNAKNANRYDNRHRRAA